MSCRKVAHLALVFALGSSGCGGRIASESNDTSNESAAPPDQAYPPPSYEGRRPRRPAGGPNEDRPPVVKPPPVVSPPPGPKPPDEGDRDPIPAGSEWERLQVLKKKMIGTWRGMATTPWVPPYFVEITFEANGHFSAKCLAASASCRAFYYGDDADSPSRVYDLNDLLANQDGVGTIYVWPSPGSWTGDLKKVAFYNASSLLTFEFYNRNIGPIVYVLERVR